jgi:hypothetical protein
MSNVRLDADGKHTVTAGDTTDAYTSLREALDAALPTVATHEKQARLRNVDTGELNGAWRWLPATDVEPAAIGGVRIDAQAIVEMADSLNARPGPIPIDGGPTPNGMLPSDVHGTASTGGGTPANGWAHWGVVVLGPGPDDAKLYLYSELVPEVAREVDAGRIATGSVHFGAATLEGELPRGVELISHALTNDPAVKTLAPANSVRTPHLLSRAVHLGTALRARTPMEKPMSTTNKTTNVRGQAMEAEAKIFAALGVDPKADDADYQLRERIWAVMSAADAEEAVEAILGGGAPPPAPVAASAAFRTKLKSLDALIVAKNAKGLAQALRDATLAAPPAAPAAGTAVAGLADAAAKDTFITQVMAALVQAGLAKEGDDAPTALAALQGAADQIKGALAGGNGSGADQQMNADSARQLARLNAEVTGLRSRLDVADARLKAADDAEALIADERWFDGEVAKRSSEKIPLKVSDADRKRVFGSRSALGAKWREDVALVYLNARHAPPTTQVMGDERPDPADGKDETALEAAKVAVRKAHPDWAEHLVVGAAMRRVQRDQRGTDA